MRSKPASRQGSLFQSRLDQILDKKHPLYTLAHVIDWPVFDEAFGGLYSEGQGRPAKATRLMVGLHYLKYANDLSDEEVVFKWVENPYWQYFCGCEYFEHELPIDPTSMTKWRNRVESAGMEKLLEETIKSGLKMKVIKKSSLKKINVDTTVQEKAIAFPTDAKLYHRMRERLVKEVKNAGIKLRQTYTFKSKKALLKQSRYGHARQMKRAAREVRNLKTWLGRVVRDIERKTCKDAQLAASFSESLALARRLLDQKRCDKNKLYSLHAPEVECISKGKAHKKYEFGCKVSVATTSKDNFIVGMAALHGNPYDGHTLKKTVEQVEKLSGIRPDEVYPDRGYRGHNYDGGATVHIARGHHKRLKPSLKKWLKRRSAIEPVIGHAKSDSRLDRNYLKGKEGDKINAILSGCGFNIRKLLKAFLRLIFKGLKFSLNPPGEEILAYQPA